MEDKVLSERRASEARGDSCVSERVWHVFPPATRKNGTEGSLHGWTDTRTVEGRVCTLMTLDQSSVNACLTMSLARAKPHGVVHVEKCESIRSESRWNAKEK